MVNLKGGITLEKYREVLAHQVSPMMQNLFPVGDEIFQEDNAAFHAVGLVHVQTWFGEHGYELQHLPWPAHLSRNFHNIYTKNGTIFL